MHHRGLPLLITVLFLTPSTVRAQAAHFAEPYSYAFLGSYRLTMEIEKEILAHCDTYDVDPQWARAICLYESGGNPDLNSHVGAQGYFQVMPRTFRGLRVQTNIEAGVKYLSQMQQRYDREDYATAAYNGGPLFVDRNRAFKLETLQYVIGVSHYRRVLKMHEENIRPVAERLQVHRVQDGEDWWSLSRDLGIPIIQLRMFNSFLAHRDRLKPGNLVVHPESPWPMRFTYQDGVVSYTSRIGDNPFSVAFVFDVPLDQFRTDNGIWRLQSLDPGLELELDLRRGSDFKDYLVRPDDTLLALAGGDSHNVWGLVRDAGLFGQRLVPGETIRIWMGTTSPGATAKPTPPDYISYKVRRGDTLSAIARKYGTTVATLRNLNRVGRSNRIIIGQVLRVPNPSS